jgi:class 3 adenylate cyclase
MQKNNVVQGAKNLILRALAFLSLYEKTVLHEHPRTYREELDRQMMKLLPAGSIWGSFQWLLFIQNDTILHPNLPILPALRVGLTLVCVTAFLYYYFSSSPRRGYLGFLGIMVYLELATAVITGMVEADPVYMSGYSLVLVLIVLVPLDIRHSFAIITASFALFFALLFWRGVKIDTAYQKYNLLNLMSAGIAAYLMCYLVNVIRRRSWEKSIIIENEREKSDKLLRNILPDTIADELKNTGRVAPRFYEEATVLFTDFLGFTQIAEKMSPAELIRELDNCFSYFDQVAKRYRLEKLKTIGDAYMCAGGIPTANKTHALDCVLAALEIRAFMQQMQEIKAGLGLPYWQLRIGIHTGPVVAGVIGESKFAYDVWGDTVNTASRMEGVGVAGEINISVHTYEQVKYFFDCGFRGRLAVKGKDAMEMYFVHNLKAEFSEDKAGKIPNATFFKIYDALSRGEYSALPVNPGYAGLSA